MNKKKITECPVCSSQNLIFRDRFYLCNNCQHETAGISDLSQFDYYNKDDVGLKVQNILESAHDSPLRLYHKKALDVILKLKNNNKICDIGCGVGTFLKLLQDKKYQVYSYDINKTQSLIANKKYNLSNVDYAETLREYCKKKKIDKGFFDVITAFEVIEHVPNVNAFIDEANIYLKRGGYLIISTPNNKRIPMRERWDYPPIHLSRFTKKNISILLQKYKFKLISWNSYNEIGYYSNNFIHKMSFSQKVLSTMVNSAENTKSIEKKLNLITNIKKFLCFLIDLPIFLTLIPFKERGHTMFFVAEKL